MEINAELTPYTKKLIKRLAKSRNISEEKALLYIFNLGIYIVESIEAGSQVYRHDLKSGEYTEFVF